MQIVHIKDKSAVCDTCGIDILDINNFKYLGIVVKHKRYSKELCECLNHHKFWIRYDIYDDQGHINPEMFTGDPNDTNYTFWQTHFSEEQKKHLLKHFVHCEECRDRFNEETLIDGWFADLIHSLQKD